MSFNNPQAEPAAGRSSHLNTVRERHKFNSYRFDNEQTIHHHIDSLRALASTCGFGNGTEDRIIEKVILEYSKVSDILEDLDIEKNITLERIMDLITAKEKMSESVENIDFHQEEQEARHVTGLKKVITKDELNMFVLSSLTNGNAMSLNEIEMSLERQLNCSLSQDDRNFVEDKYAETLIEAWLDEASENAMVVNNPHELLEKWRKINSLKDCFCLASSFDLPLPYNNLMREFCKQTKCLESQEKQLVQKFKSTFREFVFLHLAYLQEEINFYENLVLTLTRSKHIHVLRSLWNLAGFLESTEDETTSFRNLLRTIKKDCRGISMISKPLNISQALLDQDRYYLVKYIKETIAAYLKPVVISKSTHDGREILEVAGEHIVIGQVLENVEKIPGFCELEEVRFVNSGVIHIDASLNREIWHGKNIVVLTRTIIVSMDSHITWDVSGQDAQNQETQPTVRSIQGTADIDGVEGRPGESGGNVLLKCDEIENAPNLKIVSNGGKGEMGKNGDNGLDGKNGDYICEIDFKKNFPPVSKYLDKCKRENLMITKENLSDVIQTVKISSFGQLLPVTKSDFNSILEKCIEDLKDIYFETITKSGCLILFSFRNENLGFCQSFLLHKGSDGEPGKKGGKGGVGGKGGFAGEVKVVVGKKIESAEASVQVCNSEGQDGKHGKSGFDGKPGKSGLDCAYIDSSKPKIPFLSKVQFPKYFITHPSDSQRLKIVYHSEEGPERIYCSHNGQYGEIKKIDQRLESYQIIRTEKEHTQNHGNQYKIQAIRKKTINVNSMIEQYGNRSSMLDGNVFDIFADIKHMYDEIADEEILEEEQITQTQRITRQINFTLNDQKSIGFVDVCNFSQDAYSSPTAGRITCLFANENCSDWISSLQSKFDLQGLKDFLDKNNIQASYSEKDKPINEHLMLSCKYQLAVLNHLEQTSLLQNFTSLSCSSLNQKVLGSVDSTLKISDPQESFCEVESYICDDTNNTRLSIIKMLEGLSKDDFFLMKIFNLYLDDNSKFDDCEKFLSDVHLMAYKKHYNWFKLQKAKSMQTKFFPILNHLTIDDDLYSKLVNAISGQNIHLKIDVEHQICSDTSLSVFYKKYIEEVKKPFVWKSVLLSSQGLATKLVEGFKSAIQQKGPTSVFYREVVAHLFDTNILIYTTNECNQIVLVHNHNPSANEVVHILIRDDKCFKLETHEGMSKLVRTLEEKGKICNKIQFHVDLIKEREAYKEEFDKFITEHPFLLDSDNGISKCTIIRTKINHMLMEDEFIESIASSFEKNEDQQILSNRLKMLKNCYVGYHSFLYYIALHMKSEGTRLSVKELCFILNFILESVIDSSVKSNIVSWIIASQHQTDWIVELILFQLDWYLKKPLEVTKKNSWREHLRQTNRDTCMLFLNKLKQDLSFLKIEDVDEILLLISRVSEFLLSLLELSLTEWKYYLKDVFWVIQIKNTGNWSADGLKFVSFYLTNLENSYGKDLCCRFVKVIGSHSSSIVSSQDELKVLNALKLMTNKDFSFDEKLLELFSKSNVNEWEDIVKKESFSSGRERELYLLRNLIKKNSNTSELFKKTIDEIVQSVEIVGFIIKFLKGQIEVKSDLKKWVSKVLAMVKESSLNICLAPPSESKINHRMDPLFQETKEELIRDIKNNDLFSLTSNNLSKFFLIEIVLATIFVAIFILCKKSLRNTQLLAILTFIKTNKVLGQVSTGEGKSFIILAVAIMNALSGNKVDIITSSHVLAKRDAEAYKELCRLFDIDVGHNCSENIEERKTTYSKCKIVYGELSYFQRDFLLDRVYSNNILGDRTYKTIIVDEVDSMLLDKANNVLYLTHDIPGLDKLEPLFVFIWKYLNTPTNSYDNEGHSQSNDVDRLKDIILDQMYCKITTEDIRNIDSITIDDNRASEILSDLIYNGVIDSDGNVLIHESNEIMKVELRFKDDIKYLLESVMYRKKVFQVPHYLKTFVEDHLEQWIMNAINAINLKNNIDYVVDVDRTDNSSDRCPNIIIVDRDTGTDMKNSQWDQGLHQFLQLKHGCRISPLTFKAVFISNVSYLKMYTNLLGLTGTLGSIIERELLKKVYDVEFVTIPTAKPKMFTEESPIMCKSSDEWSTNIVEKVYKITETRSALIICHSLHDVFTLKKSFEDITLDKKFPKRNIHTYTRDYEKFSFENLDVGNIIISTNLAGRGTDIQLSDKLEENGGLHVCLSFLPSNSRIEEQAFGRSARNGQPGSGQMIFIHHAQDHFSKVIDLKKERDNNEVLRVNSVEQYYKTKIKVEEDWFHLFKNKYESLKESKHSKGIKSVLLMACLDKWAFWLEKNSYSQETSLNGLIESIQKLCSDDFDVWASQIQDPFQFTKLGLYYLNKDNEKAIKLFDHVIKTEPDFCEAAYYYKVCAKTLKEDIPENQFIELINELKTVEKKLKTRIEDSMFSGQFIDSIKNYNQRNNFQIDSFKEQQKTVSQTYEVFIRSIHSIIGHPLTPEAFYGISMKCQSDIDEEVINSLIFRDLLENKIILENLKDGITERDLQFSWEYGISPRIIQAILENYKRRVKKTGGIEEFFCKQIKEIQLLPSRELFWKRLISVGLLENEKKYVLVNHEKLNKIDPAFANKISNLSPIDVSTTNADEVSLYLPEELDPMVESLHDSYYMFSKDMLKKHLGDTRYKFLKQENVVLLNKKACLSKPVMQTIDLNLFDSVTVVDLIIAGIPTDRASSIIDILIKKNVIFLKKNHDPPQYGLLTNWEEIDKVDLEPHCQYMSKVKSILLHRFSFRIAIQKLQDVMPDCKGNYSNLALPLQIRLHRRFWFSLLEHDIIEKKVNIAKVNSGKLEAMYSTLMHRADYVKMFSKFYDKEKSEQIVDELIQKDGLKNTIFPQMRLVKDYLKKIISPGYGPLYTINYSDDNDKQSKRQVKLKIPKLSENLNGEIKTITQILQIHFKLSEQAQAIKSVLLCLAGGIHDVQTPKFSLVALETVLNESNTSTSEVNTFTMNGFNQVISLEEKKYTMRMKFGVFCVTALGIAEIAAGVSLQLCFLPIGPIILAQGIDDIIFSTSCVLSGHFTWNQYLLQKATAMLISMVTLGVSCFAKFKSMFGSKTAGMSVKTMKEKLLGTVSKIKTSVKSLFISEGAIQATESQVKNIIVKRVLVHFTEGVAHGIKFGVVDYIQSEKESWGKHITDALLCDIEYTITNHRVLDSVSKLWEQLGERETNRVIISVVSRVTHKNEVKVKGSFDCIDLNKYYTVIERCVSKGFKNRKLSGIKEGCAILSKIFFELPKVKLYIKEVTGLVHSILDDVQSELVIELEKGRSYLGRRDSNQDELSDVKSKTVRLMRDDIMQVFSTHITQKIVSPIIEGFERYAVKNSDRIITKARNSYLTDKEIFWLSNNKRNKPSKKSKVKKNKEGSAFFSSEFDKISCEVLKARRSKKLLGPLIPKNDAVKIDYLEMCLKVIPFALRQEGIRVPPLIIEVENKDMKKLFYIGDVKKETPTVKINANADLQSNLGSNKFLLKDIFTSLSNSFLKHYPNYKCLAADIMQNMVIEAMEAYLNSQYFEDQACNQENEMDPDGKIVNEKCIWDLMGIDEIKTECETKTPYQHSHFGGGWMFSPHVDADLRDKDRLNNLVNVQSHINNGFEIALMKVNMHIHRIQSQLRYFNLCLDDFKATKHQLAPPPPDMAELFNCYTIQYELVVPVMLNDVNRLVDFKIVLCLENKRVKNQLTFKSPLGPHILYEISPASEIKFMNKRLKGHVLLNVDCIENSFSLKDCHAAGELIMSSALLPPAVLNGSTTSVKEWSKPFRETTTRRAEGESSQSEIRREGAAHSPELSRPLSETTTRLVKGESSQSEIRREEAAQSSVEKWSNPFSVTTTRRAEDESSQSEIRREGAAHSSVEEWSNPFSVTTTRRAEDESSQSEIRREGAAHSSVEEWSNPFSVTTTRRAEDESSQSEIRREGAAHSSVEEWSNPFSVTTTRRAEDESSQSKIRGEGAAQNLSDTLVIGDSLFKYINEYLPLPKCNFQIFPYVKAHQLKMKIMRNIANEGVKCVVMFMGNDMIKTNISEYNLVTCLFDVIHCLQEHIRNVKFIVCTLTLVKQPANKFNDKIVKANRILKDFCTKENLSLVDTNIIICPQDLGKDGIHLNRSGYHKLGVHIYKVCQ